MIIFKYLALWWIFGIAISSLSTICTVYILGYFENETSLIGEKEKNEYVEEVSEDGETVEFAQQMYSCLGFIGVVLVEGLVWPIHILGNTLSILKAIKSYKKLRETED